MTITHNQLREWRADKMTLSSCKRLYPEGVPFTLEAFDALVAEGVEMHWAIGRLCPPKLRLNFVLFTLRQRHPSLAVLFRKANFSDHALALAVLRFDTLDHVLDALPTLRAARYAAYAVWIAADDRCYYAYAAWAAVSTAINVCSRRATDKIVTTAAQSAVADIGQTGEGVMDRKAEQATAIREQYAWIIERLEAKR